MLSRFRFRTLFRAFAVLSRFRRSAFRPGVTDHSRRTGCHDRFLRHLFLIEPFEQILLVLLGRVPCGGRRGRFRRVRHRRFCGCLGDLLYGFRFLLGLSRRLPFARLLIRVLDTSRPRGLAYLLRKALRRGRRLRRRRLLRFVLFGFRRAGSRFRSVVRSMHHGIRQLVMSGSDLTGEFARRLREQLLEIEGIRLFFVQRAVDRVVLRLFP